MKTERSFCIKVPTASEFFSVGSPNQLTMGVYKATENVSSYTNYRRLLYCVHYRNFHLPLSLLLVMQHKSCPVCNVCKLFMMKAFHVVLSHFVMIL